MGTFCRRSTESLIAARFRIVPAGGWLAAVGSDIVACGSELRRRARPLVASQRDVGTQVRP
jgi:hypothetical protein